MKASKNKKKKAVKNILETLVKRFKITDIFGVAIFFVILLAAAIFFLRKPTYVELTMRLSQSEALHDWYRVPAWYQEQIKPGLAQSDSLGREVLKVTDVYAYPSSDYNSQNVFVTLRIKATYSKRLDQYSYMGTPLLVGGFQTFDVRGIQITGVVQHLGTTVAREKKKYLVHAVMDSSGDGANTLSNGAEFYHANLIKPGLQVKNSLGEVLAEIKTVKKEEATRRFIYQDKFISVPDTERVKVSVDIEMTTEKVGDMYFYRKEAPIFITGYLYLDFLTFGGGFQITGFEEIK